MGNRDLDNIRIEKDIAMSMTKEIGIKIGQVLKLNFASGVDDVTRNNNIAQQIENIEIKEAFRLEEER